MGLFEDKKYDELDWMSQAVEPVETDLAGVYASIPDVIDVDFSLYSDLIKSSWSVGIGVETSIDFFVKQHYDIDRYLTSREKIVLNKYFAFEVEPGTMINFDDKAIVGSIRFVKKHAAIEEKDLISLIGEGIVDVFYTVNANGVDVSRITEMLDILGGIKPEDSKVRSQRGKLKVIERRIREIFTNDEWRIRSPKLATSFCKWVISYATDGNLAALSNICRLKLMTHSGRAIYSIEEVV